MTENSREAANNTGTDLPAADFLCLRQVNVARGDRVVLHDVNLNLRAGEHVAILDRTAAENPR